MRRVFSAVALIAAAACSGADEGRPSSGIERAVTVASSERDAARREMAELGAGGGTPLDRWRRWRARSRLERAVLELDRLQRGGLEERARAVRAATASTTGAWETIDLALDSASAALRADRWIAADSHYARASRLLDARGPFSPPEPTGEPPPIPAAVRGTRALLAQRVQIDERLARLEERRVEVAGTIARLEDDRARLAGLGRFRGVLDREAPSSRSRPAVHESTAARVLDARLAVLRAEDQRGREEEALLRTAIERIDGAIAAGTGAASELPAEEP